MSKELIVQEKSQSLDLLDMSTIAPWANVISKSSFCPAAFKGKPDEVMAVLQFGSELELKPMQSLQYITLINGKPSIYGDAALALCKSKRDFEFINETVDDDVATCTVKRRGEPEHTVTFSKEDATLAGLWGKNIWKQYPKRMLQMRARGFALRNVFPHHLSGLITIEEAQDYPEPEHKTAQATVVESKPMPNPVPMPKPVPTGTEDLYDRACGLIKEIGVSADTVKAWCAGCEVSKISEMSDPQLRMIIHEMREMLNELEMNQSNMQYEDRSGE